jgi:hypothetical protein
MENLYRFIGKYIPEIFALISSAIFFAVGLYLAFNFNPVWLNRAGALIIIIGVLLAASRFHEWVAQKVIDSIEKSPEEFSLQALDIHEKQTGTPLSDEERTKFLSMIKEQLIGNLGSQQWRVKHIGSVVEPARRRLKLWEIYLVVGGTFLNGFGDYIVSLLKNT